MLVCVLYMVSAQMCLLCNRERVRLLLHTPLCVAADRKRAQGASSSRWGVGLLDHLVPRKQPPSSLVLGCQIVVIQHPAAADRRAAAAAGFDHIRLKVQVSVRGGADCASLQRWVLLASPAKARCHASAGRSVVAKLSPGVALKLVDHEPAPHEVHQIALDRPAEERLCSKHMHIA